MRTCSKCGLEKPEAEFHRMGLGRLRADCASCHNETSRRWSKNNPERNRERVRRWRQNNPHWRPVSWPEQQRDAYYRRHYGISAAEYDAMFARQKGLCAICGQPETEVDKRTGKVRGLALDHHHETGKVRELLCGRHNRALGLLNDSLAEIVATYNYRRKHSTNDSNRIAA